MPTPSDSTDPQPSTSPEDPGVQADADTTAATTTTTTTRWWDAYPVAKSSAPGITSLDVAALIRDPDNKDYAVIDVRRNDHGGGHVRDSFQVPAQTFYDNLSEFHEKFGDRKQVIFYCSSSKGRGPRCANWYQDYLDEYGEANGTSKAYVLEGGIKAWLELYGEDEDLVDKDIDD